jgi:CheY-like chemotaxis protein
MMERAFLPGSIRAQLSMDPPRSIHQKVHIMAYERTLAGSAPLAPDAGTTVPLDREFTAAIPVGCPVYTADGDKLGTVTVTGQQERSPAWGVRVHGATALVRCGSVYSAHRETTVEDAMPDNPPLPLVAVINNSEEVVEMLQLVLEQAGYQHVTETVVNFKRGERPVDAFLALHDPHVLIWDIAIPYQENWAFFCQVRDSGVLRQRGIVLTTTNKRALELFIGPHAARELIGQPYDIEDILQAGSSRS